MIELNCIDCNLFNEEEIKHENWKKLVEERLSSIEIFYKDGTSETVEISGRVTSGNSERFAFSCAYSTGKPMLVSKIDYIVFDGERIDFAESSD